MKKIIKVLQVPVGGAFLVFKDYKYLFVKDVHRVPVGPSSEAILKAYSPLSKEDFCEW